MVQRGVLLRRVTREQGRMDKGFSKSHGLGNQGAEVSPVPHPGLCSFLRSHSLAVSYIQILTQHKQFLLYTKWDSSHRRAFFQSAVSVRGCLLFSQTNMSNNSRKCSQMALIFYLNNERY